MDMLVALYPRVSTQEQAKEGYSIGEQIERLNKYCEAMGWTVYKTYTDPGYSGGDTNRPGLQEMIKDVKAGKVDKVVVYKLDRLSRSQLDTLYLIEKVFLANGTDFVSMSENFDTSTPFGRAMIGILAVFAQLEREQIKERMTMGKEARAKEGKWGGGSTEPIGYTYNPTKDLLELDEYEAMQIRELYELFLKGTPLRRIETIFLEKGYKHKHGLWTPGGMRRIMRNKIMLGYIHYHNEWYKGEHTPIIDEETFNKGVNLLDERLIKYADYCRNPRQQTTYLGGLITCKRCGGKFSKQLNSRYREGKPKVFWYVCYSKHKRVKKMIKDPNCDNKNWKMVDLDNLIFDEIRKFAIDPDHINDVRERKNSESDTANKIQIIEQEIEKINSQISRFLDLYGIGTFTIDQVNDRVTPLNEQKVALENELESLTYSSDKLSEEEAIEIMESFDEVLERGDFDEIRLILEQLIAYIEIDKEDVYIHWKFI